MTNLKGKIDFLAIVAVEGANPNGDPLENNKPRTDVYGYGEITDVCIKRKIRNRMQDMGLPVFVQSDGREDDGCKSLHARLKAANDIYGEFSKGKKADSSVVIDAACKKWIDMRSFGAVLAFQGVPASVGIRGPVTVRTARSVDPVEITEYQITKSVNGSDKEEKSSDRMGTKYGVKFGLYVVKGSVSLQLGQLTGFSQEDAEVLKKALMTLFEGDAAAARPEGSMEVCRLYWWQHDGMSAPVNSAKVHRSVKITAKVSEPQSFDDYEVEYVDPGCEAPEVYDLY